MFCGKFILASSTAWFSELDRQSKRRTGVNRRSKMSEKEIKTEILDLDTEDLSNYAGEGVIIKTIP